MVERCTKSCLCYLLGNIYWTDHGFNIIEVARLSGLYRAVVIAEGLDQPKAIAVHPVKGCVQFFISVNTLKSTRLVCNEHVLAT